MGCSQSADLLDRLDRRSRGPPHDRLTRQTRGSSSLTRRLSSRLRFNLLLCFGTRLWRMAYSDSDSDSLMSYLSNASGWTCVGMVIKRRAHCAWRTALLHSATHPRHVDAFVEGDEFATERARRAASAFGRWITPVTTNSACVAKPSFVDTLQLPRLPAFPRLPRSLVCQRVSAEQP